MPREKKNKEKTSFFWFIPEAVQYTLDKERCDEEVAKIPKLDKQLLNVNFFGEVCTEETTTEWSTDRQRIVMHWFELQFRINCYTMEWKIPAVESNICMAYNVYSSSVSEVGGKGSSAYKWGMAC